MQRKTVDKDRPSPVVVYHDTMGSVPGSHYHKYCSNKKCVFTQYFGYHQISILHMKFTLMKTRRRFHTSFCHVKAYLIWTYFADLILRLFSANRVSIIFTVEVGHQLLLDNIAYVVLNCYNNFFYHFINRRLQDRQRLDRRRIGDAFFQYAVLKVSAWYAPHFPLHQLPLHSSTSETPTKVTEVYHGMFMNTTEVRFYIHKNTHTGWAPYYTGMLASKVWSQL